MDFQSLTNTINLVFLKHKSEIKVTSSHIYSNQKINFVESIRVKSTINASSTENEDVIEVDITLETKNRNTFMNSYYKFFICNTYFIN